MGQRDTGGWECRHIHSGGAYFKPFVFMRPRARGWLVRKKIRERISPAQLHNESFGQVTDSPSQKPRTAAGGGRTSLSRLLVVAFGEQDRLTINSVRITLGHTTWPLATRTQARQLDSFRLQMRRTGDVRRSRRRRCEWPDR